jgi:gamma-butyrobetaine dioxygenase
MSHQNRVKLDISTGGITLSNGEDKTISLHPLWVRERITTEDGFDPISHQRTYETATFPSDLAIREITAADNDNWNISFSDGYTSKLDFTLIEKELGWIEDAEAPPTPQSWTTSLNTRPEADWNDLDDPKALKTMLEGFLRYGFCIMQNTPTEKNALLELAGRFGYVRDTHWGKIFNVEKKPDATDLAYTDLALPSHTDNPYREPIPGIQFLHCLKNEVSGGFSTLVDGIAITERLAEESPEQAELLEKVNVRYRYEGPAAILENWGPMIERDHRGIVYRIRLNTKLDYVPALDTKTLDTFYAARRRIHELSNDDEFQIRFPFKEGTLLMMDNYRLLHGRTAFNGKQGHRHLQGCYTDHDGATSLYRMLANGSQLTYVPSEE